MLKPNLMMAAESATLVMESVRQRHNSTCAIKPALMLGERKLQ